MRDAAQSMDPGLVTLACGSYRRGKATCGDVDVLISHPDGKSHKGIFIKVLQILHDTSKLHLFRGRYIFFVFVYVFSLREITSLFISKDF